MRGGGLISFFHSKGGGLMREGGGLIFKSEFIAKNVIGQPTMKFQ